MKVFLAVFALFVVFEGLDYQVRRAPVEYYRAHSDRAQQTVAQCRRLQSQTQDCVAAAKSFGPPAKSAVSEWIDALRRR